MGRLQSNLDLVQGVFREVDGLEAVVGQHLPLPQDLAHGCREQILRHTL